MKKYLTTFLILFSLFSCSLTENSKDNPQRKLASIEDHESLKISQAFARDNIETAVSLSQEQCLSAGGSIIKTSKWYPEDLTYLGENFYQAATICLMDGSANEVRVKKDPNAQFCHLRSNPKKCTEIGACEWVSKTQGFCGPRNGSKDPNAQFCHIRSNPNKCEEIGVCQWNDGKGSYCKARD